MVKAISKSGHEMTLKEWQKFYGLPENSQKIGKYFSTTERKFAQDIAEFGGLVVNELLMKVLDRFREKLKKPVNINSFNRSAAKQAELTAAGFRTAKFSPHEVFMAADIDTDSPIESRTYANMIKGIANELGIKIRVGVEDYIKAGQTFIHVDVCPEYYAKGKPFHSKPHPLQWESAITW